MVGILYFIRSVTLSVTTLPPSIDTCEITVPQSMWQVIKATPDILAGNIGQCTDKIFSGHTSILVISTLFWLRYSTHWGFILYSMIHCSLGIISVLLARYHYTVDVVIGFFLTYFIHQMYYTALDQAIRQRDICRGNRMAWRKIRNSSVYSHHHRHHEEDSEEFGSHGVYKMTVLARNQDGNAEDSLWRDYDSAVGVDISGRVTPHRPQNPNADDPSFVVRKRETSTATTALSVSSEAANDPMDVSLIAPASLAAPSGISEIGEHCEIPMDQIDRGSGGQQNDVSEENEPFTDDDEDDGLEGLPFVESIRVQSTSPHRLDIMGINRSFGSFLPAIVAWMDGLDIRYK
ncbi:hypothetical protein J3B02_000516 [Coemansia erecta]|uniref:Sphingomyelin synthase-like domain-containing protein n=1 Tax=Coemansia asiatica TaxID=1052880 RepID=A0A9W8CH18_9FUNG|nr:hypothetical protein LPJ64_005368 [Coemansia asiatica]KAJ2858117.1 hypothetical protein J3B02_000516 [Coemansia erecta]